MWVMSCGCISDDEVLCLCEERTRRTEKGDSVWEPERQHHLDIRTKQIRQLLSMSMSVEGGGHLVVAASCSNSWRPRLCQHPFPSLLPLIFFSSLLLFTIIIFFSFFTLAPSSFLVLVYIFVSRFSSSAESWSSFHHRSA